VDGTGPHVLLIGDSHAAAIAPAFVALAAQHDLRLSVYAAGGCPWQRDLYTVEFEALGASVTREDCRNAKDDLYDRVIPELDPDLVVTMNLAYETPGQPVQYTGPDQRPLENGPPAYAARLEETTRDSLEQLSAGGREVLLLEPTPYLGDGFDPWACLSGAEFLEECRYVANTEPTVLEQLYRRLDRDDDQVWALDLDPLVCPFLPICDPIVNAAVVKADESHLTRDFARTLAPDLYSFLTINGVLR
jgi:hypothetical protein